MDNYNTKISELDKLLNDITDSIKKLLSIDDSAGKEAW